MAGKRRLLSDEQIEKIKKLYPEVSVANLAERYGASVSVIKTIVGQKKSRPPKIAP